MAERTQGSVPILRLRGPRGCHLRMAVGTRKGACHCPMAEGSQGSAITPQAAMGLLMPAPPS